MNRKTLRNLFNQASRSGGKPLVHVALPREAVRARFQEQGIYFKPLVVPKEKKRKKD